MLSSVLTRIGIALALALLCSGCEGCSDSDSNGSAGGSGGSGEVAGAKVSGEEEEAQDAVLAEINSRFEKMPDGWVTFRDSGNRIAPIPVLSQLREIAVSGVDSFSLSESDKMNGFEWAGEVSFKSTPCREVGEMGFVLDGINMQMIDRPKGRWSQWIDYTPGSVLVQKQNGKWRVDTDNWLLHGRKPTDADFAQVGMSR